MPQKGQGEIACPRLGEEEFSRKINADAGKILGSFICVLCGLQTPSSPIHSGDAMLNTRAVALVNSLPCPAWRSFGLPSSRSWRAAASCSDCGVKAPGRVGGGIGDGPRLHMADLADVRIVPGEIEGRPIPVVQVRTDHPVAACLASQYAGWQLAEGKFFAMGSGPMRAAYGKEKLFEEIGRREEASGGVVGVLEGRKIPPSEIVAKIAENCRVPGPEGGDAP